MKLLARLQNDDGGFPFWRRGDPSWPYVSIHVAHALQRAKEKGFAVPEQTLSRARDYLVNVERHIPREYGPDVRRTIVAYALHVRARMGDRDVARARGLLREAGVEKLSFEALGWILPLLSADPASQAEAAQVLRHLDQPGDRDRRRRALRGLLRRPGVPDPPLRSPRRRRGPGGADRRPAEERSHPEDRHRPARPPPRRALGEHAGEHVRPPRPRPLLRHLREDDARLRGPRVARRRVRGRARLPRPHHRAPPGGRADGAARRAGDDDRPRHREGRDRPPLLPRRAALRAGQPARSPPPTTASPSSASTKASTIPRTCAATRMARGGSAPAPACAST